MTNEEAKFWNLVAKRGLPQWRWLRKPKTIEEIEGELAGWNEWKVLKSRLREGDQIWPFHFQVRSYLGDREGYVVLRDGKPIGGVVVSVS